MSLSNSLEKAHPDSQKLGIMCRQSHLKNLASVQILAFVKVADSWKNEHKTYLIFKIMCYLCTNFGRVPA